MHFHLKSKMHLKYILNVVVFTFLVMNNKRHYSFLHHRKKTNTNTPPPCPKPARLLVFPKVFIISRLWAKKCSAPFQLTVTLSEHEISHQFHCAKSDTFGGVQSSSTVIDDITFQLNNSTRLHRAVIHIYLIYIFLHCYRHLGWFLHSLLFLFNSFREDYYNRLRIDYTLFNIYLCFVEVADTISCMRMSWHIHISSRSASLSGTLEDNFHLTSCKSHFCVLLERVNWSA